MGCAPIFAIAIAIPIHFIEKNHIRICNRNPLINHRCEWTLKAYSHRAKVNVKAKKIKGQSEEIKEKNSKIKENFRFRVRFPLVWIDPKGAWFWYQ